MLSESFVSDMHPPAAGTAKAYGQQHRGCHAPYDFVPAAALLVQQARIQPRRNRLAGRTCQCRAQRLSLGDVGADPQRRLGMFLKVALDDGPTIQFQFAIHIGMQILVDDRAAQFGTHAAEVTIHLNLP